MVGMFFLFWRPYCQPAMPANGGRIVHLTYYFFRPSYTGLGTAITTFSTVSSTNAHRLQNAVEAMVTLQIRHFLKCRFFFILSILWTIGCGIFWIEVISIVVVALLGFMVCVWVVLTRLVMNRMGELMMMYEQTAAVRVADLCRTFAQEQLQIQVGTGAFWLEVNSVQQAPRALEASELVSGKLIEE